jgi:hypothetical protein
MVGKGDTRVRITVIKLPKPLGRMLMALIAIFASKKEKGGDEA